MENIRNHYGLIDIGESARRQYINASTLFTAYEEARDKAAKYRGGMYWKTHTRTRIDYLVRTKTDNSQKVIGPRSTKTEEIFNIFNSTKKDVESRLQNLIEELERQRRFNRAAIVGRAPQILVELLNTFSRYGIAEHFKVIGTHALYAYEAAAGVRIEKESALETKDVDLLWSIDKKIKFQTQMKHNESSMIALLKKVDKTFEIRDDQRHTAVSDTGFEVDIIRRITPDEGPETRPNPSRMTDDEDDFLAVKASTAGALENAPTFSSVIVSSSGYMARMNTVSPIEFVKVKKNLSMLQDREPMKRSRDQLQASIVEQLVNEYLPNLLNNDPVQSSGRKR
jgi:nucleotidyltransferase-like protein